MTRNVIILVLVTFFPLIFSKYIENFSFYSPVKDAASQKWFSKAVGLSKRDYGTEYFPSNVSFNHGVASGDPESNSVVLWTKVTAPSGDYEGNIPVTVIVVELEDTDLTTPELFSDSERLLEIFSTSKIVLNGTLVTNKKVDFTLKLVAKSLKPKTRYLYQFTSSTARSLIGHTKTLPLPNDSEYSKLVIATFSCSNYPYGYFNSYKHAAERDLDVVLHLGDYIYEYENGKYGDGTPFGRIHYPNKDVVTLWDYRGRYAQYKGDSSLQKLHQRYPWIAVWDDHEFADDSYPDGAINHDIFTQGSWTMRKANAVQAYYEYMPIRQFDMFDQYALKPRIFREFEFGKLASLHMIDTRMYGREITDLLSPKKVTNVNRTMLGAVQETWLHDGLRQSKRADKHWRIIGNQVIFSHFEPAFRIAPDRDSWDNYPETRNRLLRLLDTENIDNVVFLTGDIHSSWVHEVAYNPWNETLYNRETAEGALAVEFVGPSVTSPGPGDVRYKWRFIVHLLEYLFMRNEPHLKFVDLYRHGYMLVQVTPQSIKNEYWYVSSIWSEDSSEYLGASFQVENGYSKIERLQ